MGIPISVATTQKGPPLRHAVRGPGQQERATPHRQEASERDLSDEPSDDAERHGSGVNPQAWLTDTLEKLVNRWPASRIADLMPWAYANTAA